MVNNSSRLGETAWFLIVLQLRQFGTEQTPGTPPAEEWEVEVGGQHAVAAGE